MSDLPSDLPPNAGLRPRRALLHPLWLGALALLIANDHVFKGSGVLHAIATGKLSDVAGLVVAPVLLAALVGVRSEVGLWRCHVLTGAVFALLQVSPAFAGWVDATMTAVGVPWRTWPDLTDLLALPALGVSWWGLRAALTEPCGVVHRAKQWGRVGAATVGLLACVGTSQAPPPEPPPPPPPTPMASPLVVPTPSLGLGSLAGYRWQASNEDGTWKLAYRFEADGRYTASGHPAFFESGVATVVRADRERLTLRLEQRRFEGDAEGDVERELVFAADGRSFTLNGDRYVRAENVASVALEDEATDEPR